MTGGVNIYVGKTQSGKTTRALAELRAGAQASGLPCLILDLGPSKNFREWRHEPNRSAVYDRVFGERTHAVYTPKSPEDFDAIMRAVREVGGLYVLLDEVRWVASSQRISMDLTLALRGWAHGVFGETEYHCTSQRPGDLHRDFYACLTGRLRAFKTDSYADLDRLKEYFGGDIETLRTLGIGECLTYYGGYDAQAVSAPPPAVDVA